ncbi:fatty acid desaturase [Rhizosaccharibacter radicis]|uniref:Fatty acid desaturase n=1 Tax=Rhizosaccharibacter radicis TaxID=2782605 RepID=A0ABT1W1H0_9PROT|nr:fatty acid desaturase [Acetobacteraceae bacterium KSS12]
MSTRAAAPHPVPVGDRIEWPTLLLALAIHGGWGWLCFEAARLPFWLVLPAGAWLIAWHMSLQHELIHGHPTPWRRVNRLLGSLPLSLWLPFSRYEDTHLGHHRGARLTDPVDDPESHYVSPGDYARTGRLGRLALRINSTLLGRLTLGPARGMALFLAAEARRIRAGDPAVRRAWAWHAVGVALVLLWLGPVCHLPLWRYGLLFIYPGYALALVRSFAEHRQADEADHRTAIVERAPVLGLLFLHNNLHLVHHLRPGLPWYRIPAAYRAEREALIRRNGGLVYRGYGDVARRFLFRPHDEPVHRGAVPETGG